MLGIALCHIVKRNAVLGCHVGIISGMGRSNVVALPANGSTPHANGGDTSVPSLFRSGTHRS